MSLLLDALKKAEQDKLKARESEKQVPIEDDANHSIEEEVDSSTSLTHSQDTQHVATQVAESNSPEIGEELELVIDEGFYGKEQSRSELETEESELDVSETPLTPPLESEKSAATTSTVSDEALQLLVYKTNKRYRQNQKIVWGGLLAVSTIFLVSAGTYYYLGMLDEVEALERKHKMAMRIVRAEPVKQFQNPALIETSKSESITQSSNDQVASKQAVVRAVSPLVKKIEVESEISIKKTKSVDPINLQLREAWLAYNKADYSLASNMYEKVLKQEPKNRDALLGVAAVAVKNTNYNKAKSNYSVLLKLDPRDQIAMAAMTNIEKLSSGSLSESKLKFMLQQQPTATHLNFALGNYYAKKKMWPEAQSEYFKAWQGNSENADIIYNLAVSLDQLGKPKEALRFYKESLSRSVNRNISFLRADVEKRIKIISLK